ncbi:MAG: di-heme oxidoredictase family protein [Pseudomonadota bacterium]
MIQLRPCIIAFSLVAPAAVAAGALKESHINVVPRTDAETARISAVTELATSFDQAQPYEAKSAGAATVSAFASGGSFSQPSGNITFEDELNFAVGRGMFRKLWVSSPSSTLASDGLGPLFNARSCERCHIENGRGHPPEGPEDTAISMLLRVSIPGHPDDAKGEIAGYLATRPEPTYGVQLQDFSLAGHRAEYRLEVEYQEIEVPLSGGETASLRSPVYSAANLGHGPLHPDTMLSPRVAPQMIGLGLLEAIPAVDILAWADPEDTDGDGISGRPNIVWSAEFDQPMLGRFGLKAGLPSLREQTASAFSGDIGISSPIFPAAWGECTDAQPKCRTAPHGDQDDRGFEVDDQGLDLVTFYTRNLGVPERRDVDHPLVLHGKEIFYTIGCTSCHRPSFVTHRLEGQPEQSFQLIWPYTDLLLHDMGPGLADNRPEARANGREWRTPPLWGIGMTKQVSGHTNFLHDGRARSLLEAVLWHGGEARAQRDAVVEMPPEDRHALIRFLESL